MTLTPEQSVALAHFLKLWDAPLIADVNAASDDATKAEAERDALLAERDRLRSNLKNFLSAFDTYYEMQARKQFSFDAKEAMFSAAMQARTALSGDAK